MSDSDSESEDAVAIKAAIDSVEPAKNPRSKNDVRNRVSKEESLKRGVVYIGHIPIGFAEPQMRKFFNQFGRVTRLRLARSGKTGKSKV